MDFFNDLEVVHYIAGGAILLVLMYFVVIFNNLIRLKNNVAKAWSNIDVLLKQRHEELPKLVATCKKYMEYEKGVLEKVTELRNSVNQLRQAGDVEGLGAAETEMRGALGRLFALAENYPDLKANDVFIHLTARISSLENAIADRRELYNESANINNIRIEQFPDLIVALILRFKHKALLEFSEEETGPVDVKGLFEQ
jgi:LemA protein